MKKIFLYSLIILVTSVFAGTYLVYFQAKSQGENVVLEWQTQSESGLKEFKILRKVPNGSFAEISTVISKGSNSTYQYTDKDAYKSSGKLYIYKLVFVSTTGKEDGYSDEISVDHNSVSGIKRTWGSIKAIFR